MSANGPDLGSNCRDVNSTFEKLVEETGPAGKEMRFSRTTSEKREESG